MRRYTSIVHEYVEHSTISDLQYVDLHGDVLSHVPDWHLTTSTANCFVELERVSFREELYAALKHENVDYYRQRRTDLLNTLMRFVTDSLAMKYCANYTSVFYLPDKQLKAWGKGAEKGKAISDNEMLNKLNDCTCRFISFLEGCAETFFSRDHALILEILQRTDAICDKLQALLFSSSFPSCQTLLKQPEKNSTTTTVYLPSRPPFGTGQNEPPTKSTIRAWLLNTA
jgi:hypothetical protein